MAIVYISDAESLYLYLKAKLENKAPTKEDRDLYAKIVKRYFLKGKEFPIDLTEEEIEAFEDAKDHINMVT